MLDHMTRKFIVSGQRAITKLKQDLEKAVKDFDLKDDDLGACGEVTSSSTLSPTDTHKKASEHTLTHSQTNTHACSHTVFLSNSLFFPFPNNDNNHSKSGQQLTTTLKSIVASSQELAGTRQPVRSIHDACVAGVIPPLS